MAESAAETELRVFGIVATDADVAAILCRGPSNWFHLGRWDTVSGTYRAGAWFRGQLYPQRCDVSPDGELFSYMALKYPGWAAGNTYIAISKLPWLHALAAWATDGTWSRGAYFVTDTSICDLGAPVVGSIAELQTRYGIAEASACSFAVERRRGWTETPDTPPRLERDMWDERRKVAMEKVSPTSTELCLRVSGHYAAFRSGPHDNAEVTYELLLGGNARPLPDVQWADWNSRGRLLIATREGDLRIVDVGRDTLDPLVEVRLGDMRPSPAAPPPEASRW